ncbi:hypothetical protein ABEW50_21860 [Paenibacillus jamilae]
MSKKKAPKPPPEPKKQGDRISVREWVLLTTAFAQLVTAVISLLK